MQVIELKTNEGTRLVRWVKDETMRKRMYEYIRAKKAKGIPLSQIVYTWGTRQVHHA